MGFAKKLLVHSILLAILRVTRSFLPLLNRSPAPPRNRHLGFKKLLLADTETIMDQQSIEHLKALIDKRAAARFAGDYDQADAAKLEIDAIELPTGFEIVIEDFPYRDGGGSTFKLSYTIHEEPLEGPGVLQLAHLALGMAVSHAERNSVVSLTDLTDIAGQAKDILRRWKHADDGLRSLNEGDNGAVSFKRFQSLRNASKMDVICWCAVEAELGGRKAADAAFWFALAGSVDEDLFELLAQVCVKEVRRFGGRPSCQLKDLMAICDKLAAAGVRRSADLEEAVAACASNTKMDNERSQRDFLSLHSESCVYMVWKFASRQRKQKSFLSTAAKHWETQANETQKIASTIYPAHHVEHRDWKSVFADPTRPLVVDLGCGMGISLLGLATSNSESEEITWHECNFVGADLSSLAVCYANGLATRWNLRDTLHFIVCSAEQLILDLQNYPGPVHTIMIQFPTPYRLLFNENGTVATGQSGNLQLPVSVDHGFMVTPSLLTNVLLLLGDQTHNNTVGKLIIQSNCEDVALWIYKTACRLGFTAEDAEDYVLHPADNISQRTGRWIMASNERANGPAWSAKPWLPSVARPETEVACKISNTPVHRCMLTTAATADK